MGEMKMCTQFWSGNLKGRKIFRILRKDIRDFINLVQDRVQWEAFVNTLHL
jgi:hypothetical protein